MILTDRDVFIGFHVTAVAKIKLKIEADRRHKSVSLLLSELIDDYLLVAPDEQIEPVRSNKRNLRIVLPAKPGHSHTIGADGHPTCGCSFEEEVPLPLEG